MTDHDPAIPLNSSLKDLYPNLTDQELTAADDRLCRYVALVARVHERLFAIVKHMSGSGIDSTCQAL